jgi:hypothetical protein
MNRVFVSCLLRFVAAPAVLASISTYTGAYAQSAPPWIPPPSGVVDLGDIGIGQTEVSAELPIVDDENIWFSFRLTTAITPTTWLNIDTSRSTIDTELGLYNEWANCIANDNFSGGGITLANSTASALTFGGGSGQRLGEDGAGWFGSRIDTGWNEVDRVWRPYLRAGTFYVCVVGYNADFSQCPNPHWNVSSNFVGSGTIRLRVRTGSTPATQWNEHHHGADAGDTPGGAQIVEGSGPLHTILGSFNPGERDVYKIRICDPATFRVAATPTLQWGNLYRATLFLYDADGRGVLGINNTAGGDTVLSPPAGFSLTAGDYYLAVSSYCGGIDGYQHVPYDVGGQALWNFANSGDWNRSIPPNGTGRFNAVYMNGRQSDCQTNSLAYFVKISLAGACYVGSGCEGDFNSDGALSSQDFFDFLTAFFSGCP